jgi:hypothetical protein
VLLNGSVLTTVSLYRSTTAYRSVIALPAFSLRTTTVSIRVKGSKAVLIDGLISTRV